MEDSVRPDLRRSRGFAIALTAAGVAFVAGVAYGADSKLDEANATTAKAIALLKESPAAADDRETHRKKAIDLLTRAQGEILKAKGE